MIAKVWVEKIDRFRGKPVFFKVQAILNKIPFRPVRLSRFFLLSINALPEKSYTRNPTQIRLATVEDIPGMCLLENKPDQFRTWLEQGDCCMLALDDDEIVGYEWFTVAGHHLEERFDYRIVIPSDAVYAYDAYIRKSHRMRGIWLQFKMFLRQWMADNGRKSVIVLIDYGNNPSIKTHLRFGFVPVNDVHWIRFFGRNFTFDKKVIRENGYTAKQLLQ